jgi:LysR family transcriptional regulator, hydrogen peroxide-inducible genes activator
VALADKKNFGRAAAICHVGQPTLSTQIKKLEDYLEVTLFERDNHHVSPTPIGEEVIKRARVALEALGEIRELARQARDPMDGTVRLGVIPTLAPFLLPRLLSALRHDFPDFHLVVREDPTARLLDALHNYELDAVLLSLPTEYGGIDVLPLFREPLTAALPKTHPLASATDILPEDLCNHTLLLLGPEHCLRDQVNAYLAKSLAERPDVIPDVIEASSLEMLLQLVAAGVGCSLLPTLAASPGVVGGQPDSVCFRSLAPPAPTRTLGIVWRRGYSRTPSLLGLARFLHTNLPTIVESLSLENAEGPARI